MQEDSRACEALGKIIYVYGTFPLRKGHSRPLAGVVWVQNSKTILEAANGGLSALEGVGRDGKPKMEVY